MTAGEIMEMAPREIAAALEVADIARDLVLLWEHQKIEGLPRHDRNAAIVDIRNRLTEAVQLWDSVRC